MIFIKHIYFKALSDHLNELHLSFRMISDLDTFQYAMDRIGEVGEFLNGIEKKYELSIACEAASYCCLRKIQHMWHVGNNHIQ